MLLVIFGAGASYDSDPSRPASQPKPSLYAQRMPIPRSVPRADRPPLARELFGYRFRRLLDRYSPARVLADRLRPAENPGGPSIEAEFEQLQQEAIGRATVRRQLVAARYFLREAVERSCSEWMSDINGVTNYLRLVDVLEQLTGNEVCYVTFNWDTMLDRACLDSQGWDLNKLANYIVSDTTAIVKLHGSTNWVRPVTGVSCPWSGGHGDHAAEWIMTNWSDDWSPADSYDLGDCLSFVQGQPVPFPAIAIPTRNKSEGDFQVPSDHLVALKSMLPSVDRVLVIGWRGQEHHFWELWKTNRGKSNPNVLVVDENMSAAEEVARSIRALGALDHVTAAQSYGFTGLLKDSDTLGQFLVK